MYVVGIYTLAITAFLFIGIETKGRTIEELDTELVGPALTDAAAS